MDDESARISANNTYITSPDYPRGLSEDEENTFSYTIEKEQDGASDYINDSKESIEYSSLIILINIPDICFLRLDFESLTLQGPGQSSIDEGICADKFQVSVSDHILNQSS